MSDDARGQLAVLGSSCQCGARPLKRELEERIVASELAAHPNTRDAQIKVTLVGDALRSRARVDFTSAPQRKSRS